MPDGSTLAAFAFAAFVLVAIPGPNMLYLLARSISEGRRAGVVSALGIETGTLVHITAAAAGLSALLASSATAFALVKYAGAAYLVLLGLRALVARTSRQQEQRVADPPPGANVYRQAVLVQLLNPKVAVFFVAFLPQFVDPDRPAATQIVALGLTLAAIGLAISVLTALAAATVARHVAGRGHGSRRPWGRWAGGCVYLALGTYAALSPAQHGT